jgi:hypothetical protein
MQISGRVRECPDASTHPLTSYKRPDATVKMLISAFVCGDTAVSALPTDFKIDDILPKMLPTCKAS